MIAEGEVLAALHPHIVVKVPCTADGIKAIKHFGTKGIRTNCTLVFSPGQALLAAKAGFYCRRDLRGTGAETERLRGSCYQLH